MKDASQTNYPECGTRLEAGFISYGSGLVWHKIKLHGLKRIFIFAFATERPIVGNGHQGGFLTQVCNFFGVFCEITRWGGQKIAAISMRF